MARPIILGSYQAQRGFGYIAVIFIALVLATFSGVAYEQLDTVMRRDKENEWMFVGKQYQQAIKSYYNQSPDGLKELPASVDDLVKDRRFISATHHLRRLYADPITGGDWLILTNEEGRIKGVVSRATTPILQAAKMAALDKIEAENINTYADAKFIFIPSTAPDEGQAEADLSSENELKPE